MDSELEKRMLQKLKENLQKPKEDAFESDDVVDNLRDEFKQDNFAENDSAKPVSIKELSEDDLEEELIDDDYKKGEEDFLESETITKPAPGEIMEEKANGKIIDEKLSAAYAEQAPIINNPIVQETLKPIKKKSRTGIILFLLLLFAGLIAGALYFIL
jgi:hypothetical protein